MKDLVLHYSYYMAAKENYKSIILGLLSAGAASICCIAPVFAVLGSAGAITSSLSWIEPFRPYLIGVTILVFTLAWYQKLKHSNNAECICDENQKMSFWQSKIFLSIVTVGGILLMSFPFYAKAFYPRLGAVQATVTKDSNIKQVTFKIKGMTCQACTEHVNNEVSKVKGVITYHTSFEEANCIVRFDNVKTSIDSIQAAILNTGYQVILQTTKNGHGQ